jgi:hypothetical protein
MNSVKRAEKTNKSSDIKSEKIPTYLLTEFRRRCIKCLLFIISKKAKLASSSAIRFRPVPISRLGELKFPSYLWSIYFSFSFRMVIKQLPRNSVGYPQNTFEVVLLEFLYFLS